MYISLQDIGLFLLVITALTAFGFLIIALRNINLLAVGFRKKLQDNEIKLQNLLDNLDSTLDNLSSVSIALRKNQAVFETKIPQSIENIHEITATLKQTGKKVDNSVDVINANLVETAATVTENTQDVLTYIKIVSEGIRILLDALKKD